MKTILDIDWKGGVVVYHDFTFDPKMPLMEQVELLKEDLIQVEFDHALLVDVGWYPEFSADGNFIIYVISGFDWEAPLHEYKEATYSGMLASLQELIDLASGHR